MEWVARAMGLLISGSLLTILVGLAVVTQGGTVPQADTATGSLIGVLALVGLASCIVSWRYKRLAAILLFVTALGFGIQIGVYAGGNPFRAWSMVGMPYLIAGILFFLSWRLEGTQPKTGTH